MTSIQISTSTKTMIKHNCFILVIVICVFNFFAANAQTNVSGFISSNTSWNIAGSPYIVIGNIVLTQGATLTIEPGVEIRFNTDMTLNIEGELIAIGTPQNIITFTSNQGNHW